MTHVEWLHWRLDELDVLLNGGVPVDQAMIGRALAARAWLLDRYLAWVRV